MFGLVAFPFFLFIEKSFHVYCQCCEDHNVNVIKSCISIGSQMFSKISGQIQYFVDYITITSPGEEPLPGVAVPAIQKAAASLAEVEYLLQVPTAENGVAGQREEGTM